MSTNAARTDPAVSHRKTARIWFGSIAVIAFVAVCLGVAGLARALSKHGTDRALQVAVLFVVAVVGVLVVVAALLGVTSVRTVVPETAESSPEETVGRPGPYEFWLGTVRLLALAALGIAFAGVLRAVHHGDVAWQAFAFGAAFSAVVASALVHQEARRARPGA